MTDLPFSGTKRKKPPSFENGFMIQNRIKKAKKMERMTGLDSRAAALGHSRL